MLCITLPRRRGSRPDGARYLMWYNYHFIKQLKTLYIVIMASYNDNISYVHVVHVDSAHHFTISASHLPSDVHCVKHDLLSVLKNVLSVQL